MKKNIVIGIICSIFTLVMHAQEFQQFFIDKTLRIDYIFSGNAQQQYISIDELSQLPNWAGRRHHLPNLIIDGNGQIEMKDVKTGIIIYKTSFSTLFQEWLTTDEAKNISKGFENSYLLPYPVNPTEITISLKDNRGKVTTHLKHIIDSNDVLIHQRGYAHVTPHKYLLNSGNFDECIDIAIMAEGYTKEEIGKFYQDAQMAYESLFSHEPFKKLRNKFNVIAVESISKDSGISSPGNNQWKNTILDSHFNTFYSDKYLTTGRVKNIHNILAGIPYEHIIILANTEEYGGGGIYNAFTLTTAHHKSFKSVVVHEFGHSFAGLADEYYYDGGIFSDTYPPDIEPWEQNITTLVNFDSKWKDLLSEHTQIPTAPNSKQPYRIGVYEGGGYSSKGIYRPAIDCRMKTNRATVFCPACQRAIERIITFHTNK